MQNIKDKVKPIQYIHKQTGFIATKDNMETYTIERNTIKIKKVPIQLIENTKDWKQIQNKP